MATWARYKGDGSEHYPGIPMRNLTDEDREALDKDQRKLVQEGSLYKVRDDTPKPEPAPEPVPVAVVEPTPEVESVAVAEPTPEPTPAVAPQPA